MDIINYTLSESERLIKTKVDLNRSHPFYSYILMHMQIEKTKHTDKVPTIAVNQYGNLYWNQDFTSTLNNDELSFCLAHEVGHIATLTFQREGKRDMTLWNIATDLVINYMLLDEGFIAPKDILVPNHKGVYKFSSGKNKKTISIDLNDKNAELVYEELYNNAKIIKQYVNADEEGNYTGQIDKHIEGDKDDTGMTTGKGKTIADQKANENDWKRKIVEGVTHAKMRGTLNANMERLLGEILSPVVDWRQKLFAYITNDLPVDFTMRTPSRRFISTGVYTPTVIRESLELIVGIDISGSITNEEYIEFMAEVVGISSAYRQVNMRVIAWAASIDERDDVEITNATREQLLQCKFYGGGGTELTCLTDYIHKHNYNTRLLVILTDGYIESNPILPDGVDCLFVMSKNGTSDIIKRFGDVTSLNNVIK